MPNAGTPLLERVEGGVPVPEQVNSPPAADWQGARIVVIDDSVSVCRAVERMVAMRGAQVVALHTGEEALARIEHERPDLVICDLRLPDVEGFEVCRFVRESRALAGIPILAITGLSSEEKRQRALDVGADAVLKKPFRSEVLLAGIDALWAETRARRSTQPAPEPTLRRPSSESAPPPPALPERAQLVLDQLNSLNGLIACTWHLSNGASGHWSPAALPAEDADVLLGGLRGYAASFGLMKPEMVVVEEEGGAVLLAQRANCGLVCLQVGKQSLHEGLAGCDVQKAGTCKRDLGKCIETVEASLYALSELARVFLRSFRCSQRAIALERRKIRPVRHTDSTEGRIQIFRSKGIAHKATEVFGEREH